jgi:hypothetical protein
MASGTAIVPGNREAPPGLLRSTELSVRLITTRIADALCYTCSMLEFGIEEKDSEPLDIHQPVIYTTCSQVRATCPLCNILGIVFEHQIVCYTPFVTIHQGRPSRNVVFFLDRFAFVHRLSAGDTLPRAISPNIGVANSALISNWVRFCCRNHGTTCGKKPAHFVPGLKLIDCTSRRICVAMPGQRYAALSYVWGPSVPHEPPGAVPQSFPRTIEDAISVAKQLQFPYLWVDRYCIDQGNEQEKHIMISNMDMIYSGAEVTIIAAAGSDPHYGIPGVSTTVRHAAPIHAFDHGSLIDWKNPISEIARSRWGRRGWTYQEMLLSRRRLVFTDSQMIFQCCTEEFQEFLSISTPYDPTRDPDRPTARDIDRYRLNLGCTQKVAPPSRMPHLRASRINNIFPANGIGTSAKDIYQRIEEYTMRNLSYTDDILNAFVGIFGAFGRNIRGYKTHFWGIPILGEYPDLMRQQWAESFVTGLAWYSLSPVERRPGSWPSWSWIAVMGLGVKHYTSQFRCPFPLECTYTNERGSKESVYQYVQGKHDYTKYHQWIDLTTWVIGSCELHNGTFTHPGLQGMDAWMDVKRKESLIERDVWGYTGVFLFANTKHAYFLVTEDADENGSLRRVGLGCITHNYYGHTKTSDYFPWQPSVKAHTSLKNWKYKTVRLV